jgi:hypothetical protein
VDDDDLGRDALALEALREACAAYANHVMARHRERRHRPIPPALRRVAAVDKPDLLRQIFGRRVQSRFRFRRACENGSARFPREVLDVKTSGFVVDRQLTVEIELTKPEVFPR